MAVMFFIGLAASDDGSRAQAHAYARQRRWGPPIVPSYLYGALGWAVWLDPWEDRFIDDPTAYAAVQGRLQRRFHRQVGEFTGAMSIVTQLLARYGGKFAVRVMENTLDDDMNRVLTPFMFGSMTIPNIVDMGMSGSIGLRKRAYQQPYSRANDWLRTIYGSNLYILPCILMPMALACVEVKFQQNTPSTRRRSHRRSRAASGTSGTGGVPGGRTAPAAATNRRWGIYCGSSAPLLRRT